ncbi:hypothetical protein BACCAP_03986 [Pseudoflavonifractor capillosus ATCC 29799]|uniref:Uncharacterized protein n=1 Tax=Pseudoflavonifractor capillosus ATCC 29799 TaxID=411467 RepID=A6P0H5_9FIRM|nr:MULTISPECIES: UpxZ family transcription anti-terminator antagonist [Oscillospiraceae]EDM98107.1 hypothetical protein BACCAP_03986 [Pseudoflavonifractor capillosus ATCC 29799]OUN03308.1 hypothetical protein B5G43_15440 [Flavonifractor sp. An92]OUQ18946.1 hypothetical protein B5E80_17700 [Flavonifractor sp. An135]OUQ59007.1 hypothetical protein B5E56_09630 [Flavonifractor sp. An112]
MTECYRYAVDTYAQMTEDEKAKISLELLYNAICYYHGEAEEIVQELLRMDQETLSKFEASLAATRQQVKKMHQAALAAMSALRQSVFASGDVEDILFYRIANNLPIE